MVASDIELPVIMLLLCLFEIISQCDLRWVVHLRGARDLVLLRRRHQAAASRDGGVPFSDTFFAYQYVIGRTACGEQPVFNSSYWDTDDSIIDGWLGCSPALVSIVARVTELSRQRAQIPESAFLSQAASLESDLDSLEQLPPGEMDAVLIHVAELKFLAAKVVFYASLHNADPHTPLIRELVGTILRSFRGMPQSGSRAALLWPLFVAAVELDPQDDDFESDVNDNNAFTGRRMVLDELEILALNSLANVARARAVIVKIWQSRDDSDAETLQPRIAGANDWERFVAPFCSNMSLA